MNARSFSALIDQIVLSPLHHRTMIAFGYTVVFVLGLFLLQVSLHSFVHGDGKEIVVNPLQMCLALFLSINALICFWEIVLFFYIERIQRSFEGKKKRLERGSVGNVFLFEEASISELLSMSFWSEVWATYSLLDRSYSDSGSFGWNIDIGNGFTTLPPTILFGLGMSMNDALLPPKILGMIGLVSFYQEFYGTVLYFTQYVVNKRYNDHGTTPFQIFLMVLIPNAIWFVFPAVGMYASADLILREDWTIFNKKLTSIQFF